MANWKLSPCEEIASFSEVTTKDVGDLVKFAFGVGKACFGEGMVAFCYALEIVYEAKAAFCVETGAVCVEMVAFYALLGFLRLNGVFRAVPMLLLPFSVSIIISVVVE